jgi:hypothetical protein
LTVDSAREELPGTGPTAVLQRTPRDTPDTAGLLLARLTVLPALLTLPFLLTSFPLLLLGWFKPVPVIVAWLLLSAVIVPMGWRRVPSVSRAADIGAADTSAAGAASVAGGSRTPWWTIATLLAVVLVFGIDQTIYHSQFIIVMLDPASYMQFAAWISQHGSLPIPQDASAFGGAPGISFASPAFYQVGSTIVPQFMAGLPMALSLGFWAGGARVAVLMGPLFGAAAVLTFGGLVARLVGSRWAALASLVLAVSLPQQFTSRSTYSETLAQILFLGGLSLWFDSQRTDRGPADAGSWRRNWRSATHVLAGLTGLALGLALLVRIDGPSDIIMVIPFCGVLVLQRRQQVIPLFLGLVLGLAYGAVDGLVLSRPYLKTNISSVMPMTAAFILLTALTALVVMVLLMREQGLPRVPPRLADAVMILPFLVIGAFAVRPYVEKDWAKLEYAPISLHWVYWYIGGPVIVLATIATAILARQCLRGRAPAWVLPLLVFGWSIVEFLYRPAITPHQPWASRRLVPAVLPGLILLAVWLTSWLVQRVRALRFEGLSPFLERVPQVGVVACCAVAMILPPAVTSFGLGIRDSGSQGFRLIADGLAFRRTYVGEITAVNEMCAAIPPDSSVLFVDNTLMREFAEDIRGMCGVPTAGVQPVTYGGVEADVRAIERAGRHPVLFAASHSELAPFTNGIVRKVMTLYTSIDQRLILEWPRNTDPVRITVYRWEPSQ